MIDKDRVVRAYLNGTPSADIARQFQCSREYVRQILKASGCVMPRELRAPICKVRGCHAPNNNAGYCWFHIYRKRKYGDPKWKPKKEKLIHGTCKMYERERCRCDLCRKWKTDATRKYRAERLGRPVPDEAHGTANGYVNWACRCDPCKAAGAAYNRLARDRRLAREQSTILT